jgi:hypothetical protein
MNVSEGSADDSQDPSRREPVAASVLLSKGETDETIVVKEHPSMSSHNNNRSVLEDSLLVDHQETLHEIPVTPVKEARPPSHVFDACEEKEESYCLEVIQEEEPKELQVGDHVYQWRSWMGLPGVFQHHGIVMDILQDGDETKLTIADFSNVPQSAKQRKRGLTQEGILRTYTDTDTWHKVHYEAPWWKRQVYRAGTCTGTKSDAIGLVLARVNFIVHHPDVLPDYHVVYANCECVAFWCKTGKWSTLQASSFLELTAAGQVKSSTTLAAMAANTQVAVPASGVWGWFGYTSQVSYLSLHPMVLPALAGYAVVTVGGPAVLYVNARARWKETSRRLCDAFWESAMEHPDVFAECITHWSDKR